MKNYLILILALCLSITAHAQTGEKNPLADFEVGKPSHQQSFERLPRTAQMTPQAVKGHGLTPVIMCTVDGKCSGTTPAQARAHGISPIVLCTAKTYCQGNTTVKEMEAAGLVPSIVCESNGTCGGVNYEEILKQGYSPIIICRSLNDCKTMPLVNKVQYVKPCSDLNSCGF